MAIRPERWEMAKAAAGGAVLGVLAHVTFQVLFNWYGGFPRAVAEGLLLGALVGMTMRRVARWDR